MSAYDDEGDWPAFPHHFTPESIGDCVGMTLRQYAAIKLRVPNSDTEWLDNMIRQSLRDELAGKVVQALISAHGGYQDDNTAPHAIPSFSEDAPDVIQAAEYAYSQADAMLSTRGKS